MVGAPRRPGGKRSGVLKVLPRPKRSRARVRRKLKPFSLTPAESCDLLSKLGLGTKAVGASDVLESVAGILKMYWFRVNARDTPGTVLSDLGALLRALKKAQREVEPVARLLMTHGWRWEGGQEAELSRLISMVSRCIEATKSYRGKPGPLPNWPLKLAFEELRLLYHHVTGTQELDRALRDFICAALATARIKYPDPDAHPTRFAAFLKIGT